MFNRRGVTPLQPAAFGSGQMSSMPPSPARSSQVSLAQQQQQQQPLSAANTPTASTSPTRRTPMTRYKNSSDSVAAVLGSSGVYNSTSALRSSGSSSGTRGQSTPPTPSRPSGQGVLPGLPMNLISGANSQLRQSTSAGLLASSASQPPPTPPSGNAQPLQYEFKVLSSSGKTSHNPVQLFVGSGCLQGFRPTMEDEHFNLPSAAVVESQPVSVFGILDGHCGRRVAELGSRYVPECFLSHPALGQNNALALAESIVQADRSIFQAMGKTDGGSTLIIAVVHGRMLFVACLGDARAVVYDGIATVAMSEDHKPSDIREQQRIVRCGGTVQFGRVCGCLAVSRALGDYEFKFAGNRFSNQRELMVSNLADVKQINITDSTKFLVMACDGLWDVLANEEATQFVVDYLKRIGAEKLRNADSKVLDDCALKLADYAIERGSMDNVSVTIVFFHDVATTIALEPAHTVSLTMVSSHVLGPHPQTPIFGLQRGSVPSLPSPYTSGSPLKRTPLVGRR